MLSSVFAFLSNVNNAFSFASKLSLDLTSSEELWEFQWHCLS